jgi:hypothetical protein
MFDSGNPAHSHHEVPPTFPLGVEDLSSFGCQRIVPPPALFALLHPAPHYPAPFFEAIKQWVERSDMEP